MTEKPSILTLGEIAYDAYCTKCHWESACGEPLPVFSTLQPLLQQAWQTAAEATQPGARELAAPPFTAASVKVMRSYDYCHFEVSLSANAQDVRQVDELRKDAARLADKAVEQYKAAKENAELLVDDANNLSYLKTKHSEILDNPESERTPEEKAIVKTIADRTHRIRARYDYQDDWTEPDWAADS